MSAKQSRSSIVFQKLDRQLAKLCAKPGAETIHKFRTTGRRVEAMLEELAPAKNRNGKKLLKMLARLRRKAGRVRDLDVQIHALRNLRLPEGTVHKDQLMRALADERSRREKKLVKALDRATVRELHRRLKRAGTEIEIVKSEALSHAVDVMAKVGRDSGPLTEKTLHQYRIAGKRARYLAELAGEDTEAVRLVEQLEHMQDLIGDWHDWLKLTARAEGLFAGVQRSTLVAALRNVTRAKFRQAVDALAETRAGFSAKKPMLIETNRTAPQAAKNAVA